MESNPDGMYMSPNDGKYGDKSLLVAGEFVSSFLAPNRTVSEITADVVALTAGKAGCVHFAGMGRTEPASAALPSN